MTWCAYCTLPNRIIQWQPGLLWFLDAGCGGSFINPNDCAILCSLVILGMMLLKYFQPALLKGLQRRGLSVAAASSLISLLTAAGCGQLAQKERELTFAIEPGIAGWYNGIPDGIIESYLPVVSAGKTQTLHAWWWPAERDDAPALLYLHGARWNLTGHVFRLEQFRRFGFSILAIDYRGFGRSQGELPSEATVYEDARVAWDYLTQLQPDPAKRYIYGHSLGGAVAVDLAARLRSAPSAEQAKGLIVESSFSSLADVARVFSHRWLPIQLLLTQKFDSMRKIKKIDMPVLIVHGAADPYIPPSLSEKLYKAAGDDKRLLLIEGGNHNNSIWTGEREYRRALKEVFGWQPSAA